MRPAGAVLIALALAACGRLGFDSERASAPGDGAPDAVATAGRPDATTPTDAALPAAVNRAFVTSDQFAGAFGGIAAADDLCGSAATKAGLDGMYVAWLSTATVDARDRLTGSRGWIRTDGAPLLDKPTDLVAGGLLSPLDLDEHGQPAPAETWTGTGSDGTVASGSTCGDWTSGGFGTPGGTADGMPTFTIASGADACANQHALYCFEVGHIGVPPPATTAGRVVFVSSAPYAGGGIKALDTECGKEASAAGLTGTFLAGVATSTGSPQSRFGSALSPWVRVDGTVVASETALFTGSHTSFVNQHADGSFVAAATIFTGVQNGAGSSTGTAMTSCTNWTVATMAAVGTDGDAARTEATAFWGTTTITCDTALPYLCLQQ